MLRTGGQLFSGWLESSSQKRPRCAAVKLDPQMTLRLVDSWVLRQTTAHAIFEAEGTSGTQIPKVLLIGRGTSSAQAKKNYPLAFGDPEDVGGQTAHNLLRRPFWLRSGQKLRDIGGDHRQSAAMLLRAGAAPLRWRRC